MEAKAIQQHNIGMTQSYQVVMHQWDAARAATTISYVSQP